MEAVAIAAGNSCEFLVGQLDCIDVGIHRFISL
jgi:hypothetical protein